MSTKFALFTEIEDCAITVSNFDLDGDSIYSNYVHISTIPFEYSEDGSKPKLPENAFNFSVDNMVAFMNKKELESLIEILTKAKDMM